MCCKRVCVCAVGRSLWGKQATPCPKLSGALWVTELIAELRPFLTRQPIAHLIYDIQFKKNVKKIFNNNTKKDTHIRRSDLELLLQLAVETRQHSVGLLVFADGRLDLPPVSARQPERQVGELSNGSSLAFKDKSLLTSFFFFFFYKGL